MTPYSDMVPDPVKSFSLFTPGTIMAALCTGFLKLWINYGFLGSILTKVQQEAVHPPKNLKRQQMMGVVARNLK